MIPLIDSKTTVTLYSLADNAIDAEASNTTRYLETLDARHLKFKEGSTPTGFEVHALSPIDGAEILMDSFAGLQDERDKMRASLEFGQRHFDKGIVAFRSVRKPGDLVKADSEDGQAILAAIPYRIKTEVGGYIQRLSEGPLPAEDDPASDLGNS